MLDRIVLHVGMPKTGSTSIQQVLSSLAMPRHRYAQLGPANHSVRLLTVFGGPREYARQLEFGVRQAQIDRRKAMWRETLDAEVAGCDRPCLIFSGEGLSGAYASAAMVAELGAYMKARARRVDVIAYVRPPAAFINSNFQQEIKIGRRFAEALSPVRYRARLEPFDEVFGREAVTLVPFRPDALAGGDVVADLAARIGVDLPEAGAERANESLSKELVAVLATVNAMGADLGTYPRARAEREAVIAALQGFGSKRLQLSQSVIAPVLAQMEDQIAWLEDRMGQPMRDKVPEDPDAVASEADLWNEAAAQAEALEARMLKSLHAQDDKPRRVAEMLDMMRVIEIGRAGHAARRNDAG